MKVDLKKIQQMKGSGKTKKLYKNLVELKVAPPALAESERISTNETPQLLSTRLAKMTSRIKNLGGEQ